MSFQVKATNDAGRAMVPALQELCVRHPSVRDCSRRCCRLRDAGSRPKRHAKQRHGAGIGGLGDLRLLPYTRCCTAHVLTVRPAGQWPTAVPPPPDLATCVMRVRNGAGCHTEPGQVCYMVTTDGRHGCGMPWIFRIVLASNQAHTQVHHQTGMPQQNTIVWPLPAIHRGYPDQRCWACTKACATAAWVIS